MKKNKQIESLKKEPGRATPIIIKAISFFIIFGSSIGILFYAYIFIFNSNILNEEINLVTNPFLSLKQYILLEITIFVLLITGAVLILYSNKKGFIIIGGALLSLLGMHCIYIERIDWFYIILSLIILSILIFSWKKIK